MDRAECFTPIPVTPGWGPLVTRETGNVLAVAVASYWLPEVNNRVIRALGWLSFQYTERVLNEARERLRDGQV